MKLLICKTNEHNSQLHSDDWEWDSPWWRRGIPRDVPPGIPSATSSPGRSSNYRSAETWTTVRRWFLRTRPTRRPSLLESELCQCSKLSPAHHINCKTQARTNACTHAPVCWSFSKSLWDGKMHIRSQAELNGNGGCSLLVAYWPIGLVQRSAATSAVSAVITWTGWILAALLSQQGDSTKKIIDIIINYYYYYLNQIKSNSYFSIRFDSKWVQLFEIFEYLPSLIS